MTSAWFLKSAWWRLVHFLEILGTGQCSSVTSRDTPSAPHPLESTFCPWAQATEILVGSRDWWNAGRTYLREHSRNPQDEDIAGNSDMSRPSGVLLSRTSMGVPFSSGTHTAAITRGFFTSEQLKTCLEITPDVKHALGIKSKTRKHVLLHSQSQLIRLWSGWLRPFP